LQYVKPRNEEELLVQLQREGAMVVCGATDVLVRMRRGMSPPELVVDIADLHELKGISVSTDMIVIGAATTEEVLLRERAVGCQLPLLVEVLRSLASPQIRSRGTLGGNIANASPAADSAIPLLLYEASVQIVGTGGQRDVPIDRFFIGPGRTALRPGEYIRSIAVPVPRVQWHAFYHKVGQRRGLVIAVASLGMLICCRNGVVEEARLAAGSVAPTPMRLRTVESLLLNRTLGEALALEAARLATSTVRPIDDIRATARYRRQVIGDLLQEFLGSACGLAGGSR
jgi:CO/xanthine dehydrogenase FAD-binding subunit